MPWVPTNGKNHSRRLFISKDDLDCIKNITGPFKQRELDILYWKIGRKFTIYEWEKDELWLEWNTDKKEGIKKFEMLQYVDIPKCKNPVNAYVLKTLRDYREDIIKNYIYKDESANSKSRKQVLERVNKKYNLSKEMTPDTKNNIFIKTVVAVAELAKDLNIDDIVDVLTAYINNNGYKSSYLKIYRRMNELTRYNQAYSELLDNIIDLQGPYNNGKCPSDTKKMTLGNFDEVQEKLDERDVDYGELKDDIWYIKYGSIYYTRLLPSGNLQLCMDTGINTNEEYERFIRFVKDDNSPLTDIFEDPAVNPNKLFQENTIRNLFVNELIPIKLLDEELTWRSKIGNVTENRILQGINETFSDDQIPTNFNEIYDCLVNESDLKQNKSNFRREPFMKYAVHINCKRFSNEQQETFKRAKEGMIKVLKYVKNKYKDKLTEKRYKYFVIKMEGGGSKHYDYGLYALTESDLDNDVQYLNDRKNVFAKLEFKSDKDANSISGLSKFLSKSLNLIFETVNNTYRDKLFYKRISFKNAVKDDYFKMAFENTLKSQYNKVFIIWNSTEQEVYIEQFTKQDLQIDWIEHGDASTIQQDERIILHMKSRKRIQVLLEWGNKSITAKFKLLS